MKNCCAVIMLDAKDTSYRPVQLDFYFHDMRARKLRAPRVDACSSVSIT